MPKVSVVLPTYNGEQFLAQSIESIINQTFQDWELIIVNDCSTDSTLEIANEYAGKDSRIRVVSNEVNKKLPESLNVGFRLAKGEYLTWTSDDNYYLPNAVEKMVNYLDNNSNDMMVCANMDTIDENGIIIGTFAKYDKELMLYNDCVGACFLYRKIVLQNIGNYNSDWSLVEDYEYWLRIYFECGTIGHLDEILYRYRYHGNSLTCQRMREIRLQLHKLRKLYLEKLCEGLKNNIQLLGSVFAEMMPLERESIQFADVFIKKYKAFEIVKRYDNKRRTVIYGAGDYGNRAFQLIGNNVEYYVDSDLKKIGKSYNDRLIISLENYMEMMNELQLVIAVSNDKIGQLICDLYNKGLKECCMYQMIEGDYE